ncbi:MAG: cytochrome C oxidase subunit IV family protein [Anaerolineae bacterium]|nr:cytochrome C oxidase subunit IV family protein [Anaerolineae bacterium]
MSDQATHQYSGHSKRPYTRIFVALVAVTFVEMLLTLQQFIPHEFLPIPLVILSFAKIALVAMYYMHLYGDNKLFTYMFLVPVPFVLLIMAALIIDLLV